MYHKQAIENFPLQVYASALVFSPAHSLIRLLFKDEKPKWIKMKPATEDEWSACLQTLEGHIVRVNSVAFSHDSIWLASASFDRTIKIWDLDSGSCLRTLEGHNDWINSVIFSHDSTRLASASRDRMVKVWDQGSGECLYTLSIGKPLSYMSFDITGSHLHTEIGTIVLDASSAEETIPSVIETQKPRRQGAGLSPDGVWITYDSEDLLWLPSEYRPFCSAVSGEMISIGTGHGKLCVFVIDI